MSLSKLKRFLPILLVIAFVFLPKFLPSDIRRALTDHGLIVHIVFVIIAIYSFWKGIQCTDKRKRIVLLVSSLLPLVFAGLALSGIIQLSIMSVVIPYVA